MYALQYTQVVFLLSVENLRCALNKCKECTKKKKKKDYKQLNKLHKSRQVGDKLYIAHSSNGIF